jgi:hypothetical protein
MKTKLFALFVLVTGFVALGTQAQVPDTSAPQANQMVYSPRLPSAAELTNAASAQGLTIDKIVQSASQMTVVYRTASGQTNTVAYMLLPSSGNASAGAPASAAPVVTVAAPSTPAPQVVYAQAPASEVVYYSAAPAYYDPYYYPAYYSPWYAPVALSVGFGFGYHGGFYHGGYYHGGGWHGHR